MDTYYTTKETADILKVSTRTIHRYIKGKYKYILKAQRVGGKWLIAETDLKDFINHTI